MEESAFPTGPPKGSYAAEIAMSGESISATGVGGPSWIRTNDQPVMSRPL